VAARDDKRLGAGRTCFVIGPIGSKLAAIGTAGRAAYEESIRIWEKVLEPACAHFDLAPVRADRIAQPGEITAQIFEWLRDADVVIADVSGGNANVMYELGLRHTRDRPTVQIGEYERLPFDVNVIRTIQFTRTEAGLLDLRGELIEALRAALLGGATRLTPTLAFGAELESRLDAVDVDVDRFLGMVEYILGRLRAGELALDPEARRFLRNVVELSETGIGRALHRVVASSRRMSDLGRSAQELLDGYRADGS
jgi:hypothetical protein